MLVLEGGHVKILLNKEMEVDHFNHLQEGMSDVVKE